MNITNEKLSAVRRKKALLQKEMDNEPNRHKRMGIANKIRLLNYEEKELLKQLGVTIE